MRNWHPEDYAFYGYLLIVGMILLVTTIGVVFFSTPPNC